MEELAYSLHSRSIQTPTMPLPSVHCMVFAKCNGKVVKLKANTASLNSSPIIYFSSSQIHNFFSERSQEWPLNTAQKPVKLKSLYHTSEFSSTSPQKHQHVPTCPRTSFVPCFTPNILNFVSSISLLVPSSFFLSLPLFHPFPVFLPSPVLVLLPE